MDEEQQPAILTVEDRFPPPEKICKWCGDKFVPDHKGQDYCSSTCYEQTHR